MDANLWASLVTRIFEQLGEHVQRIESQSGVGYRSLLTQLETSIILLARTRQRLDLAEAAFEHAKERRRYARDQSWSRTTPTSANK
jgi:hypothetical protein